MQQISKSQGCSSRYPIKWKWRTLALSKTNYSYCYFQPTWPPVPGLFTPPQPQREILQKDAPRAVPKAASQIFHFPSPFPSGAPMAAQAPLLMEHPPQRGAGLPAEPQTASRFRTILHNPSLLHPSVPKIVLMYCQSFLFILQALQRHFL